MTNVASAVSGAATGSASDASSRSPKTTDARVMERIIITVPTTVGVTIRRTMTSHYEMASCITAETRTNAVSVDGPPSATAVMQNGVAKMAVNMGKTAPAPTGPSRRTCTIVDRPQTRSEAKTIQMRKESSRPEALATMTGVTSRVAEAELQALTQRGEQGWVFVRLVAGVLRRCRRQIRLPPQPAIGGPSWIRTTDLALIRGAL